jgi:hypothetical protein
MAELQIDPRTVVLTLSVAEKVEAVHGDVTIPRTAITAAHAVPDGMAEVHGLRAPGTGVPGVLVVGTFHDHGVVTFAVCHGHHPAVVLELTGHVFARVVFTHADPESIVAELG